jgi:hypothetical protein
MRIKLVVIAVSSVIGFLLAGPSGLAADQPSPVLPKTAATKKVADPFLNGPPFKFDQVVRLLRQSAIPLRRRKEAIQHRGLAFSLSPEGIDKLKAAGASEEMLNVIKSKAKTDTASVPSVVPPPAPAPPPPPKRPEGKLAVRCAPAECEVSLNDTPRGVTHDGNLEVAELPVGQWTIDFRKKGYLDRQTIVAIEPDRTVSVSEVLAPTRATREAFGAELFQKVVNAIGTPDGKEPVAVEAYGSTTTWSCEGRSVRWLLWMRNQPDRGLFQVKSGKDALREVAFVGSQYTTSKKLKGQEAVELAADAGLIRDNQLSVLITALITGTRDAKFKMLANHSVPVAGEEFTLVAEGTNEKISIALGDDLLPRQVQIVSSTGAGARMVSYSDYIKSENLSYPKTIQIKPEGWIHALEVHFDKVTINPKLTESDYKPRKKPLSDLGS